MALSHFPELKDVQIEFVETKAKFPMSSHPNLLSLIFPFKKRSYQVTISTKSFNALEHILLKRLPLNAQIGVIGHELAHTSRYLNKNSWQIIWVGMQYLFSDAFRKNFEIQADEETINHGLGMELLSWRNYYEALPLKEKSFSTIFFEDRYLHSDEIKRRMRKNAK